MGDLILRRWQSNQGRHKLTPPWEGPYIVVEVLKPGTYKLADERGAIFTNELEHRTNTSILPLEFQSFLFQCTFCTKAL